MKYAKFITIFAMVLLCTTFVSAKLYSDSPSGQGTSTVGTTGADYTSLLDASLDFNSTANTGNWTLEITTDLTEPVNVCFGNIMLSTSTVIIKPAAATSPTVTFTATADNAGPSGYIIIGSSTNGSTGWDMATTCQMNNFIIDGSNNGSTSRDLTLTNTAVTHTYATLVMVFGANTAITVQNTNIVNWGSGNSEIGIRFCTRSTAGLGVLIQDNAVVRNCYIQVTSGSGYTYAVVVNEGGTQGSEMMNSLLIENSELYARTRPFMSYACRNLTIRNNIWGGQGVGGYDANVIWDYDKNGATGWTCDIYNNRIVQMKHLTSTAGYGMTGINAACSGGTYNIYNNTVGGFEFTSGTNPNIRGIYCGGDSNYYIAYNSVNVPDVGAVGNAPTATYGIRFHTYAATGAVTCVNNIVRMEQANGVCLFSSNTSALTSGTFDYNDLFAGDSSYTGCLASDSSGTWIYTGYPTLAEWTTASLQDINSQSVNPAATGPAKWVSNSDLSWSAATSAYPLLAGTPIAITTDIDGNTRDVTKPWPGAVENNIAGVSIQPVPVELSQFETVVGVKP